MFDAPTINPNKRRLQDATLPRTDRAGRAKIDVIVLVAVLGLLAALIVPAVLSSRERGRTRTCANYMRMLGLAAITYENSKRRFPGFLDTLTFQTPVLDAEGRLHATLPVGWPVMLLPNLDSNDYWRRWKDGDADFPGTWLNVDNNKEWIEAFKMQPYLHCPSDGPYSVGGNKLS